jgi:hypothetical protein
MADDGRSALVNGKNVYQDSNGNWIGMGEFTSEEMKSFSDYTKGVQRSSLIKRAKRAFCRVKSKVSLS